MVRILPLSEMNGAASKNLCQMQGQLPTKIGSSSLKTVYHFKGQVLDTVCNSFLDFLLPSTRREKQAPLLFSRIVEAHTRSLTYISTYSKLLLICKLYTAPCFPPAWGKGKLEGQGKTRETEMLLFSLVGNNI